MFLYRKRKILYNKKRRIQTVNMISGIMLHLGVEAFSFRDEVGNSHLPSKKFLKNISVL